MHVTKQEAGWAPPQLQTTLPPGLPILVIALPHHCTPPSHHLAGGGCASGMRAGHAHPTPRSPPKYAPASPSLIPFRPTFQQLPWPAARPSPQPTGGTGGVAGSAHGMQPVRHEGASEGASGCGTRKGRAGRAVGLAQHAICMSTQLQCAVLGPRSRPMGCGPQRMPGPAPALACRPRPKGCAPPLRTLAAPPAPAGPGRMGGEGVGRVGHANSGLGRPLAL